MTYVVIGTEALIILLLLAALLYGQPAANATNLARIDSQQTEVARFRSTLNAVPPPTPFRRIP